VIGRYAFASHGVFSWFGYWYCYCVFPFCGKVSTTHATIKQACYWIVMYGRVALWWLSIFCLVLELCSCV